MTNDKKQLALTQLQDADLVLSRVIGDVRDGYLDTAFDRLARVTTRLLLAKANIVSLRNELKAAK